MPETSPIAFVKEVYTVASMPIQHLGPGPQTTTYPRLLLPPDYHICRPSEVFRTPLNITCCFHRKTGNIMQWYSEGFQITSDGVRYLPDSWKGSRDGQWLLMGPSHSST